ncbi:MAG TPA: hypothetical protein VFB22_15605 [Candidatus Baltobacteraceae bacterium]|nr:hypothetical protein [Candidatus Baltobacteraceae bacterium]
MTKTKQFDLALLPLVVWAACAGALVGRAPRQIDWDLSWQRLLGEHVLHAHRLPSRIGAETFTAPNAPWTPQEWLFSTLYALAHRAHADVAFGLAIGAVAALALAVVARTVAVRGGGTIAQCTALPAVTLAMFGGLAVRAQTVAWLPFALVAHALAKRKPFWAVPATIAWCNVHASGVLAPALVGVWAAGRTLESRRFDREVCRAWLATIACGLATLATPLGIGLPKYALMLSTSPIRADIGEWLSAIAYPMLQFWFVAVPLVAVLIAACATRRVPWPDRFVAAMLFAMAVMAVRNIPQLTIAVAPMATALFARPRERTDVARAALAPAGAREIRLGARVRFAVTAIGAACVFAATLHGAVNGAFGPVGVPRLPSQALARLEAAPGTHRLLCGDFGWCSGVLGAPRVRVFLDGRCDPYPPSVWKDYETVVGVRPGWRTVLARRGVDAIVVERGKKLARALRADPRWTVTYDDGTFELVRARRVIAAGG